MGHQQPDHQWQKGSGVLFIHVRVIVLVNEGQYSDVVVCPVGGVPDPAAGDSSLL